MTTCKFCRRRPEYKRLYINFWKNINQGSISREKDQHDTCYSRGCSLKTPGRKALRDRSIEESVGQEIWRKKGICGATWRVRSASLKNSRASVRWQSNLRPICLMPSFCSVYHLIFLPHMYIYKYMWSIK